MLAHVTGAPVMVQYMIRHNIFFYKTENRNKQQKNVYL